MQEMTTFAHPIELSDKELDLVAAGGGGSCCGGERRNNNQVGLVNIANNGNINVLDQVLSPGSLFIG